MHFGLWQLLTVQVLFLPSCVLVFLYFHLFIYLFFCFCLYHLFYIIYIYLPILYLYCVEIANNWLTEEEILQINCITDLQQENAMMRVHLFNAQQAYLNLVTLYMKGRNHPDFVSKRQYCFLSGSR